MSFEPVRKTSRGVSIGGGFCTLRLGMLRLSQEDVSVCGLGHRVALFACKVTGRLALRAAREGDVDTWALVEGQRGLSVATALRQIGGDVKRAYGVLPVERKDGMLIVLVPGCGPRAKAQRQGGGGL